MLVTAPKRPSCTFRIQTLLTHASPTGLLKSATLPLWVAILEHQWPPAFRPLQLFMPGRQEAFTQPVQAAPLSSEMH